MIRRSTSSFSATLMDCSSSNCNNRSSPSTLNVALISVRAHPVRITEVSARSPRTSPRASINMDFPAPVSPVRTVRPSLNDNSTFSTTARLLILRCFNIILKLFVRTGGCHPWRDIRRFDKPQPRHPWLTVRRETDTLSVCFFFRLTPSSIYP